jgi:hypothetical protein
MAVFGTSSLDIIHHLAFYLKQLFGDSFLSPSSGETFSVGQVMGVCIRLRSVA